MSQELLTVLETRPFLFAIELGALAARREFLNLEMWISNKVDEYKDEFVDACIDYLQDKLVPYPEAENRPNLNNHLETASIMIRTIWMKKRFLLFLFFNPLS